MELSFSDLRKRDVINVSDGSNLGHVSNVVIRFPEGRLVGIAVPGRRKRGFFALFDRSELYIDEHRIIKIGGDVILVNLSCGEVCGDYVSAPPPHGNKQRPRPPYPPPCPPSGKPNKPDCKELFGDLDNGEEY